MDDMRPAKLYIAYTQDDEVITLGTIEQLAKWFDTTPNNIRSLASHFKKGNIKKTRVKFYRLEDLEEVQEDDDGDAYTTAYINYELDK